MKLVRCKFLAIIPFLTASAAHALIIGADTRVEMYEIPADWQETAQATLAIGRADRIVKVGRQWKTFTGNYTLATSPDYTPPIHPEHRFADQGQFADCTGFLINPDTAITAAHCINDGTASSALVDYQLVAAGVGYASADAKKTTPLMLPIDASHVSRIEKVLYAGTPSLKSVSDSDFAILRLKTPIFTVKPLSLQRGFTGTYETPVAIFGHALGLPLKADLQGRLSAPTSPSEKWIYASLDTGHANSGGPILDLAKRGVVGILIAHRADWDQCEHSPDVTQISKYFCEVNRFDRVEDLKSSDGWDRKTVAEYRAKYPSGYITAWSSRVLRVDPIMDKLDELGIAYSTR